MKCDKVLEVMPAFADKSVGAEQAIELTEHLGSCAACAAAWKRHQAVDHFFRSESLPELPASFWMKSRRQILEQIAWTVPAESFPMRRLIWLAAAAVLVGIGITLFGPGSRTNDPGLGAARPSPTVAPEPITSLDATPDPTMAEPSTHPEPVVSPDLAQGTPSPTPTPEVSPDQTPDPIVRPEPTTTPSPETTPDPTPDPIVRPEPTATVTPAPTPDLPPPVLAMRLPGDADYLKIIVEEQISIIRAKDENETLPALLVSSRKRILEMEIASVHRPDAMPELVDSYVALVGEGMDELLLRKIAAAVRNDVKFELASQLKALEKIKGAEAATTACKTVVAGRTLQATFHSKAKLGLLAMIRELDQVALAAGLDKRMEKAAAICNNRLVDFDKAQAAGSVAAMEQAADAYEAILNRGIVDAILNAHNTGTNVSTPKARMLAKIQAHLKKYEAALKAAKKAEVKAALGLVIEAARVAKERLSRIEDTPSNNGGGKQTPWPTSLPGGSSEPAPSPTGTVDPGFDPNPK